jgi:hypothetical protein
VTEEIITTLADLTEGFIGAEIEQIVISALFEAFSEERCIVFTDFEKVIKNTVPLSITQAEQIRSLREWANVRAVAATPKEHRVQYIEKPEQTDDDIRTARGGRTVDF